MAQIHLDADNIAENSPDFCFSILLELQRTVGHLLQICVVHLRHLRQAKISQLS